MASAWADAVDGSWMGRLAAAPSPSRVLDEAASSLDAEYAVLSEASAKSAELQAMLRNSQPLLWLDNALVLQRQKRDTRLKKRVGAADVQKAKRVEAAESGAEVAMLESELRRRRRVQWEVAKRIARVEREISKRLPAERSWHVREKKRREEEAARRRKDEEEERQRRRREERELLERRQRDQQRKQRARQREQQQEDDQKQRKVALKPEEVEPSAKVSGGSVRPADGDVNLDFEWPVKPIVKTPRDVVDSSDEQQADKENAPPPSPAPETSSRASVHDETPNVPGALGRIARESLADPLKEASQSQLRPPSPPLFDPAVSDDDEPRPQPRHGDAMQPASKSESSLGRQVLSEYRTMPSGVLFGAPPITKAPHQERKLNSDVLRRLFSDLDTDHDGHLNRIETCMALHRLQIRVPAPQIVAFFKRLHAVDGASNEPNHKKTAAGRRQETMREVINYKQFVAFVTTAFDRQNELRRNQTHTPRAAKLPVAMPPALTQPASSSPSGGASPPAPTSSPKNLSAVGRASVTVEEDQKERRVVEQNNEEESLADQVLQQLPDVLVAQALTTVEPPRRTRADVKQIVRRSLENLVRRSGDLLDDSTVEQVAHDVVGKFVKSLLTQQANGELDEDVGDVTGLRRAAMFFEAEEVALPESGEFTDDEINPPSDLWRVLTEEQVTVLVEEVWRQRQAPTVQLVKLVAEEHESQLSSVGALRPDADASEERTPMSQSATEDKETDMSDFSTKYVQRVAEKAIQTSISDWPTPDMPPATVAASRPSVETDAEAFAAPSAPPPPPPPLEPPPVRSALARAILSHGNLEQRTKLRPAGAEDVIANLRRQRRLRQTTNSTVSSASESSSARSSRSEKVLQVPLREVPIDVMERTMSHVIVQEDDSATEQERLASAEPLSVPVKEKRIQTRSPSNQVFRSVRSSSELFSSDSSGSSVRSGHRSSTGSSINLFRQLDPRVHLRRTKASMTSLRPRDSIDEDDLSEGEIPRRGGGGELSDGELFGSTRRKVARFKNAKLASTALDDEDTVDQNDIVQSSAELGEMLPSLATLQRKYQQNLFQSSCSSLESGEAEVGAVHD